MNGEQLDRHYSYSPSSTHVMLCFALHSLSTVGPLHWRRHSSPDRSLEMLPELIYAITRQELGRRCIQDFPE